jgi:hypothetical protein
LTTNQKGLIAETAIIHECAKLGVGVAQPLDDERYDLILDLRPRLLRVQCKWAVLDGDVVVARLYSNRRSAAGMVTRRYDPEDIDAFGVHCADVNQSYLLPPSTCAHRTVLLRLRPTKNNQAVGIRWASDYELAARLRELQGP